MSARRRLTFGLGIAVSLAALSQVLIVRGQSGPRSVYDLEPAGRQHRRGAVFRAQADQQDQRAPARAAVVPSRAGSRRALRLQPAGRRRRDVCGRQRQRGVRARGRDRKGNLDLRDEGTRPIAGSTTGRAADRSDRRIIFASRSYLQQLDARTGKPIASFGGERPRESARRARTDAHADRRCTVGIAGPRVRKPARPGLSTGRRIQLASRRHSRVRRADRQARLDVPHDSSSGRVRLRTPGRRTHGRPQEAPTRGPSSLSTKSAASVTSRSARRPSICGAAIAKGTTCSATRWSRSTFAPASVCGTTSCSITICGTTISSRDPSC